MRVMPRGFIALLFAVLPALAHAADPADLSAAKRALQAATDSVSVPAMVKARARFQALSAAEPKDVSLRLWVGTATWRAVPLMVRTDAPRAERLLRDGLAQVDEAIKLDPKNGEALALKAGLQGLLIQFDRSSMMTLGPESEANLQRAQVLAPESPRVWFLQGIQTLHKPAEFGGSPTLARGQLERSIDLFARDSVVDSTAYDWGRGDADLWAGQAALRSGDPDGAVAHYQASLQHDPENRWVKYVLLPAALDSLAKRKP